MAAADAQFTVLYEEHASRVYTYLMRMTSSEADAADALQEAFTGLYVRLSEGAAIDHPRAYLFAAARNAALRRFSEADRASVVSEVPEQPASSPLGDGEVAVLTGDLRAEVRAVERTLPARQREVLVLREVEELSYADIASLMGVTENGAAQLAWRARAALRAGLRGTALRSIAPAGAACERARTLLELREDAPLEAAEETWVDEHLGGCARCAASRAAMLEIGTTYRAAFPLALAPLAAEALLRTAEAGAAPSLAGGDGGSSGFVANFSVPVGAATGVVVIVLAIGSYLAGVAPGARGSDDLPATSPVALAASDPAKPIAAARRHAAKAASQRRADAQRAAAPATTAKKKPEKGAATATAERKSSPRKAKRRTDRPGGGTITRASSNGGPATGRPTDSGGSSATPEPAPATAPAQAPAPAKAVAPAVVTPPKTRKEPRRATPAVPATPAQPKAGIPATPATPAVPAAPAAPSAPEACAPKGNNGQGRGGAKC